MNGKQVRLRRILQNGKAVIIPMDHGVSSGPIPGVKKIEETIRKLEKGGATAILTHKGIMRSLTKVPKTGLIVHFSASTSLGPDPNWKVLVGSVEEAIRIGADAVSVHVNIGCEKEPEMLVKLGMIAEACDEWQIPLLAMMYPRGKNVRDQFDPKVVAHVARVGAELGADIIKTNYTGSVETFKEVVEGCPVPVVIAGGPKVDSDLEVLKMVRGAMDAGAIGVSMGRNVFQHENVEAITRALRKIIVGNKSVEEAAKELRRE
ncbi:MAG: 2-amino-3,7-dideoxy-D-threo-hept-6-ulosonate synthase [Candidatus Odinarchaeia archaeon]